MDTIEHEIAHRYLGIWSRAAASGPTQGSGERRLLIVDASEDDPAGTNPPGPRGDPFPHPITALLASMTNSAASHTAVIVVREDPAAADAALAALDAAGWAGRTRRATGTDPLPDAEPGSVWVLEASLSAATPLLLPLLGSPTQVLVHAAPATPAALSFPILHALVGHPNLDLLLRLPMADLARLARYRTTPVADLPLHLRRLAEGYSSLLGDTRWEWLALWRAAEAEEGIEAAQTGVAERFRARLAGAVPDASIHRFAVPSSAAGAGGVPQFVLATHEPERVLQFNRILFELRAEGRVPWVAPSDPAVRLENPGVLDLFAAEGTPPAAASTGLEYGPRTRVVDAQALAHRLADHFAERTVPLGDVMRFVAASGVFPDEVRDVLRLLRRERRVAYTSLRAGDDRLRFGDQDAAPSPQRRGSRKSAAPELW